MKGLISDFDLISAANLPQALQLLSSQPELRPFAGGTDLMVLFESGKLKSGRMLSLHNLRELSGIVTDEKSITIKALTTFANIRRHPLIQKEFPLLARAAGEIGAVAIQERATIGGNIINASPAADSPPALLCYDAEVELQSMHGIRYLPYQQFHVDYKRMQIKPGELLTAIRLPRPESSKIFREFFHKVGTRRYQAISKVCFAARFELHNNAIVEARLAWGALAPIVKRSIQCEQMLRGKSLRDVKSATFVSSILNQLQQEISPIDDIRSTAAFRRAVAANLLKHYLQKL